MTVAKLRGGDDYSSMYFGTSMNTFVKACFCGFF